MIEDARPPIATARPRRGEAEDAVAQGSTVLRGDGPARERVRSLEWGVGSGEWGAGTGPTGRRISPSLTPHSPLPTPRDLPSVVHEFTAAWERGESPAAEGYLRRLDPADVDGAVDLIYREYCLAEADGVAPDPESYIARFPRYAEALRRVLDVHGACSPSLLGRLLGPPPLPAGSRPFAEPGSELPQAGDTIGPYVLRRELGRGSFARVFLAEEADLANRLVVVKIATRSTREPWLLARARHAHIVEILSHAVVDDGAFQLICMPFWGGATLADVLAAPPKPSHRSGQVPGPAKANRGPGPGGRAPAPATGADLLAALDAVAAPEYPSVHPARPREILAPLPYDRAIAWVIARLAEALDHAASRDVTHGDVKPSNVLLSADGSPMLLDFNLAREGAPAVDASGRPIDPGGTLAYMAPERLRALAGGGADPGCHREEWSLSPAGGGGPASDASAARSAHVADIYALGVVLLEALSGRPPLAATTMPGGQDADPASRPARLLATMRAYATARERPAQALVRDVEVASGRPIAPALRAILGRCLDPDPARRYRRALELAEDLDRWRTDRPLAYAEEPFWGEVVPRWLRLKRRRLIVAAVSLLAVGLAMTALMLLGSNRLLQRDFMAWARDKLVQWWDGPESEAFLRTQRVYAPLNASGPDDPRSLEVARRALRDYDVLGEGDLPAMDDWRLRDGVRYLAPADREDLEAWLMERAYEYCRALEDRPDSPDDWRRALKILDRASGEWSVRAWTPLRDRLASRLRGATSPRGIVPAPAWLDEHLLGLAAEWQSDAESEADPGPPKVSARDRRTALEQALGHYDKVLVIRPGSFWAHYRSAAACFGLAQLSKAFVASPPSFDPALEERRSSEAALASRRLSEACHHLARCLERRPGNAAVQGQLAGCLFDLEQYPEALVACDRALKLAPGYAELYRTRNFARLFLRQTAGLDDEVRRFEMLSQVLPREFWDGAAAAGSSSSAARPIASVFRGLADLGNGSARGAGPGKVVGVKPEEIETRATFAGHLREAEQFFLAEAEVEKILVIQPDHIPARLMRAEQAILARRFDAARADLDAVLDHPGLEDYVRSLARARALVRFFEVTELYLKAGRAADARRVAERARDLALLIRGDVGGAHYNLAQVYAVLGATDPLLIEEAAKQLFRAFVAHPYGLQRYREESPWFDPVRTRIDAALARMEDPMEVRRRRMAGPSAKAPTRVAER